MSDVEKWIWNNGLAIFLLVIVSATVGLAIKNMRDAPIRKNGKCVGGLVYSVDKHMNPTFNRLDADGKPQRCTEVQQ